MVGLLVGMQYIDAWTGPTGIPATNNVPAPVNLGASAQVKAGSLGVTTLLADAVWSYEYCDQTGANCKTGGAPVQTIRTNTATLAVSGDKANVSCVVGETLTGGGCQVINTYDEDNQEGDLYSYPTGNTWTCESGNLLNAQITASAVCIQF